MSTTATAPTAPKVTTAEFERHFIAARTYLTFNFPFFASLLGHLKLKVTDGMETAAVDAKDNLYINPGFFVGLKNVKLQAFLLAHEVMHPALGIFWRGRGHQPVLSNIAHDHVINLLLKSEDSSWIIEGSCCDDKFKGMAYEEVYRQLVDEQKKQKGGKGGKQPQSGQGSGEGQGAPKPGQKNAGSGSQRLPMADVIPGDKPQDGEGEGSDDGEMERSAQKWTTRIIEAQLYAKGIGKSSVAGERILELAQGGTVPWQELMRQAITEAIVHDRTNWNYPHRRAEAFGVYMPREEFHGCDATIVVDTSGSISTKNVESALREIGDIITAAGGRVRWLVGDTAVLQDEWITEAPEKISGCGGTDFRPFFEHLTNGEGKPTKMLIYFTDTYGVFPEEEPPFPVIWAVYDENKEPTVPFGEVIQIPASAD